MEHDKTLNSKLILQTNDQPREKVPFLTSLNTALFDLNSRMGKTVNIFSMVVIIVSVIMSMISTLDVITESQRNTIHIIEFVVTLGFTMEYFLRLIAAKNPKGYALSFYGLIDLLTWLPLLLFGDANLAIRLLRLMRLLKLIRYLRAVHLFLSSLQDTIDTLIVVVFAIVIIILFSGNLIHTVEPETFPDAFLGSWWGLVTMTTVGYGDIVPHTGLGKLIAAGLMLCGITMFAMLTATISVKISAVLNSTESNKDHQGEKRHHFNYCPECGIKQKNKKISECFHCQHEIDSTVQFCSACGQDQTLPSTSPVIS